MSANIFPSSPFPQAFLLQGYYSLVFLAPKDLLQKKFFVSPFSTAFLFKTFVILQMSPVFFAQYSSHATYLFS